jgi:acyl carrier protein
MINEIKIIMADILQENINEIEIAAYGKLPNWDSMRHFLLIIALEELWKCELNDTEAAKLNSFIEIKKYYEKNIKPEVL